MQNVIIATHNQYKNYRDILHFYTKFLKSCVYFILTAHLNSDANFLSEILDLKFQKI